MPWLAPLFSSIAEAVALEVKLGAVVSDAATVIVNVPVSVSVPSVTV
jgi:hypothetical protein